MMDDKQEKIKISLDGSNVYKEMLISEIKLKSIRETFNLRGGTVVLEFENGVRVTDDQIDSIKNLEHGSIATIRHKKKSSIFYNKQVLVLIFVGLLYYVFSFDKFIDRMNDKMHCYNFFMSNNIYNKEQFKNWLISIHPDGEGRDDLFIYFAHDLNKCKNISPDIGLFFKLYYPLWSMISAGSFRFLILVVVSLVMKSRSNFQKFILLVFVFVMIIPVVMARKSSLDVVTGALVQKYDDYVHKLTGIPPCANKVTEMLRTCIHSGNIYDDIYFYWKDGDGVPVFVSISVPVGWAKALTDASYSAGLAYFAVNLLDGFQLKDIAALWGGKKITEDMEKRRTIVQEFRRLETLSGERDEL